MPFQQRIGAVIAALVGRIGLAPRYGVAMWAAAIYLGINLLVRIALAAFDGDLSTFAPHRLAPILAVGMLYDLAALAYVLVPFALLALAWPNSRVGRAGHAVTALAMLVVAVAGMLFVAVSEAIFWNEFSARFNFIAVDYLIYTREVIGNIRESYPVGTILAGIGVAAALIVYAARGAVVRAALADGAGAGHRARVAAAAIALAGASFALVGDAPREALRSPAHRELAGNGYYDFMRAFRSNDLSFRAFYRTMTERRAGEVLWQEFVEARSRSARTPLASNPIEREVRGAGPQRTWNVVLVSIESLGADYVGAFGGRAGLTPNLDRIAREGLRFSRIYATGQRTVRGLEALTLSVPPTPGHAVPVRRDNKGLQTLGGVLREAGYDALYLYGGYAYFDNMRDFFGGNGYEVIDRTDIAKAHITHENVWGVADEDVYGQALREIDRRTAAGRRVFAHVMTTSNHRPFTFPGGRIDLASGSGRDAAVKYTDWAIGQFIAEAARRAWFERTVFVFVADHTSNGRGRTDLPPENFHIPLVIYAPGLVPAGEVATLASQIDVAPTLLALLNVSYRSRFFGQDILTEGLSHQRAFMANYLTVGYMEAGMVVELSPKQRVRVVDAQTGELVSAANASAAELADEAIAYYQVAARVLKERSAAAPGAAPARPR